VARALYAPAWLNDTGKAAFRHAASVLEELGEDPRLSAGAIERYAAAVSIATGLQQRWQANGELELALPIARAQRQAHELAEALGLTPASRRKMARGPALHAGGRPAGAASAPDRAAPIRLPRRPPRNVVELHPELERIFADADAGSGAPDRG